MSKQLLKATLIYGAGDVIIKIISVLIFPLFTHLLSLHDFGTLSLVTAISAMVTILIGLGINNTVQLFYFDPAYKERQSELISSTLMFILVWSFIAVVLSVALYIPFRDILREQFSIEPKYVLWSVFATIPLQILRFSTVVLRLQYKPWKMNIISIAINLLGLIVALVLMYYFDMGLDGYFLGNFLAPAIFAPIAIVFIKKDLIIKISMPIIRQMIRVGYPYLYAQLAYWLFGSVDRWLLGQYSSNREVGLYSIALKIGLISAIINSAFAQSWSPYIMQQVHTDENYKEKVKSIFTRFYASMVLIGAAISFFSTEALRFLTPQEYWSASLPAVFIIMGLVFNSTAQFTILGVSLTKETKYIARATWIALFVNIIVNMLLVKRWGALGAGVAFMFTYLFMTLMYYYYSRKRHDIEFPIQKIIQITFLLIAVTGLSILFNLLNWNYAIIGYKILAIAVLVVVMEKMKVLPFRQLIMMGRMKFNSIIARKS